MFHAIAGFEMSSRMRPGNSAELFGQAALLMLSLRRYAGTGRPMIKASPHIVQPHSRQSPSSASGQLEGSA